MVAIPDRPVGSLPSSNWSWLRPFVERFEQAWQRGERPAIEDCLPADAAGRLAVLAALVQVDLERRLKAGEAARSEEYLRRFPVLAAAPSAVLALIARE